MKHNLILGSLMFVVGAFCAEMGACTSGQRQVAKTAIDVATEACHVMFGQHPEELPPCVTLEDFCKVEENVQPFIDHLLSAREGIARKLGTVRTRVPKDAGAD